MTIPVMYEAAFKTNVSIESVPISGTGRCDECIQIASGVPVFACKLQAGHEGACRSGLSSDAVYLVWDRRKF